MTCICTIIDHPCTPTCSCVSSLSSSGCLFCASYGSRSQQLNKAYKLVNIITTQLMALNIYLSGGFRSGWQEEVQSTFLLDYNVKFFDPSLPKYRSLSVSEYVASDLKHINSCDVVFAYLEKSNPLALGLNAELGYAKALGKYIILVEEPRGDVPYTRAFNFTRELADVCVTTLEDGYEYLRSYVDQVRVDFI